MINNVGEKKLCIEERKNEILFQKIVATCQGGKAVTKLTITC